MKIFGMRLKITAKWPKTTLEKCQKSTEYQELLDQKFTKLEETIHSEIHRINVSLATRNMDDYKKNLKWFEDQKVAIEKGIENVKAENLAK